jgi:hypothetical protein
MRLSEIALKLPKAQKNLLSVYTAVCAEAVTDEQPSIALHPQLAADMINRLSPYARETLSYTLRMFGAIPFEEEQLLAAALSAGSGSGLGIRMGLLELQQAGIVFAFRKTWGDTFYFLPSDAFPIWLQALVPAAVEPLTEAEARSVLRSGEERPAFGLQLLGFLAALARYGMSYTSKGILAKKTIEKAAARLALTNADLAELSVSYAYKEHYPLPFAVALDTALGLGLLREDGQGLCWNHTALLGWLAMPEPARELQLIRICSEKLTAYRRPVMHAAAAMAGLQAGAWYPLGDLDGWLKQETGAGEDGHWRSWVEALRGLGWLQIGEGKDGEEVFRWLCDPSGITENEWQAEPVRMLPSCDIYVLPEADFRIRWELEAMAELIASDRMAVYRIDGRSIARAVENGRDAAYITAILERFCGMPLPAEAAVSIRGWAGQACRVSFAETVLLVCETKEMADRIAAVPQVAPLLGNRLGDKHFAIDGHKQTDLRKQLERAGFPPRKQTTRLLDPGMPAVPSVPKMDIASLDNSQISLFPKVETTKAILYAEGSPRHYELLSEPVLAQDLHRLAKDIPAAWTAGPGRYHASTKREILERAISLQIPVLLATGSRKTELLPERLNGGAVRWTVEGRVRSGADAGKVTLSPEMWEDTMLCLPDPFRK